MKVYFRYRKSHALNFIEKKIVVLPTGKIATRPPFFRFSSLIYTLITEFLVTDFLTNLFFYYLTRHSAPEKTQWVIQVPLQHGMLITTCCIFVTRNYYLIALKYLWFSDFVPVLIYSFCLKMNNWFDWFEQLVLINVTWIVWMPWDLIIIIINGLT